MNREAPNQSSGLCASSALMPLYCCGSALLFFLSLLPLPAIAQVSIEPELNELTVLAQTGMADFSLALLEREQPSLESDPDGWLEWQQQRMVILGEQGRWSAVIDEYEGFPVSARLRLRLYVVEAYLAQADGESARDLLLPLIWDDSGNEPDSLAELRRLVILSYLVEGRQSDAHSAMVRYEQDYSHTANHQGWNAIKARVLIAEGQFDDAALLTAVSESVEGKAVYVLALLKGSAAMDQHLADETVTALKSMRLDQPLRQALFVAALEKVSTLREWADRIVILQRMLAVTTVGDARTGIAVDALWHAYSEHGQEVANRQQLLVGDFASWFEAASQLRSTSQPQASALYVWLALNLKDEALTAKAHEEFAALVRLQSQGDQLLRTLYLSSSQYTDVKELPLVVIYPLIDLALDESDLTQAARLMSQLDAPNGVDLLEWQLRRARLQILTGSASAGTALLRQLVSSQSLSNRQVDYLLSAVFDLQNGNHHEMAYELLSTLLPKLPDLEKHRQMLYWMADSLLAQGDPLEAARLYLRSATLMGRDVKDVWAQSARFQAAEALIEAGVVADGLMLYRSLLPLTDNPVRRGQLQREIQRHSAPQ